MKNLIDKHRRYYKQTPMGQSQDSSAYLFRLCERQENAETG